MLDFSPARILIYGKGSENYLRILQTYCPTSDIDCMAPDYTPYVSKYNLILITSLCNLQCIPDFLDPYGVIILPNCYHALYRSIMTYYDILDIQDGVACLRLPLPPGGICPDPSSLSDSQGSSSRSPDPSSGDADE